MNDLAAPANSSSQQSEDRFARDLRGFGPLGILAVLVIFAGNLIGQSAVAKVVTVLLTAILFGSLHYYVQGLAGA